MKIKYNNAPNLKRPKFDVDKPLDKKLDDFEITKLMNKSNFTLFLGKAGSGKSSLLISFLNTKPLFNKVYNRIILFCPPGSRNSISDDFWSKLPEDCIFDKVTPETLQTAYDMAQEEAEDDRTTLFIFDDVQKYFKENENKKLLLHFCNNRRHARLSMWVACQNYKQLIPDLRNGLTDAFIFKCSKKALETIHEEMLEISKTSFEQIVNKCYHKPHSFMYINTGSGRIFSNWDEILFS